MLNNRQPLSDHDMGYVGFTHVPGLLADGICYFERWSRLSDIAVSHALVVTGPNQCVEAHWQGVQPAALAKYLDDPKTVVVFRRPRGWTAELGARIATAAEAQIGSSYNVGLIAAQCMSNTFLGHYLNKWFHGRPEAWVSKKLDKQNEFICSELAAWALNEQPELRGRGILAEPMDTISPQELFEDDAVFELNEKIEPGAAGAQADCPARPGRGVRAAVSADRAATARDAVEGVATGARMGAVVRAGRGK